ncbi:uncharacterized protein LOC127878434 isoform X2 [Dreissena polymorpha]|uniref:CABIT domain-containing protein n=2 Tax=Dreissena polymorpha TaxID=45954 RepID=A0A9D4MNJ1_DREPO|nr:uncharacterized protein LOC127878434 isoform X2 [Dreissena polymorpha]XP_052280934.1 uncharacterized protein LOC127878434 isoform X2 [Dreissena polymorpha]KAH3880550.1 hypothetical protein DPMN_004466 [Dreissena polymorpha]
MNNITMASSSTNGRYTYENTGSIRDVLSGRRFSLPAVVRVTPSDYEITNSDDFPGDAELLIDKLDQVKYARIKVIPFTKEERVVAFKGSEFVRRRSELVGREFFLPAEYHGHVRCIPRPGYRKSFTAISQVLQDMPRYVKVCVDTQSCLTSGELDLGPKVCSGTVLLLRKIYTVKDSIFRYLICSVGEQHFHFREDQQVKMETLGDGQLHHWSELENLAMLPVCVQFEYTNPNEIVCNDDEAAETLLTILTGPIEVTQFVTSDMLLGWISNGENKPCTKVVLLRKTARDVTMWPKANMNDGEGLDYIHKHFGQYSDTQWLRSSMYALKADVAYKERFVWLKRSLSSGPIVASPMQSSSETPTNAGKRIKSKPVALIRPSFRPTSAPKPRHVCSGDRPSSTEYVQGGIANNEANEGDPPLSPKQADDSEHDEKGTKWMEWKKKIKGIHAELMSFVQKRSSSKDDFYLTCIFDETENERDGDISTKLSVSEPFEALNDPLGNASELNPRGLNVPDRVLDSNARILKVEKAADILQLQGNEAYIVVSENGNSEPTETHLEPTPCAHVKTDNNVFASALPVFTPTSQKANTEQKYVLSEEHNLPSRMDWEANTGDCVNTGDYVNIKGMTDASCNMNNPIAPHHKDTTRNQHFCDTRDITGIEDLLSVQTQSLKPPVKDLKIREHECDYTNIQKMEQHTYLRIQNFKPSMFQRHTHQSDQTRVMSRSPCHNQTRIDSLLTDNQSVQSHEGTRSRLKIPAIPLKKQDFRK